MSCNNMVKVMTAWARTNGWDPNAIVGDRFDWSDKRVMEGEFWEPSVAALPGQVNPPITAPGIEPVSQSDYTRSARPPSPPGRHAPGRVGAEQRGRGAGGDAGDKSY